MKKRLFSILTIIFTLTAVLSAGFKPVVYATTTTKVVGYSMGLLQKDDVDTAKDSYEGYAFINNMPYSNATQFTADGNTIPATTATLSYNGNSVTYTKTGAATANVTFAIPATYDSIARPIGATYSEISYSVNKLAPSMYISLPAATSSTEQIQIGTGTSTIGSGKIGFQYSNAGTASYAVTGASFYNAGDKISNRVLQLLTGNIATSSMWSWAWNETKNEQRVAASPILNGLLPRYGGTLTTVDGIKIDGGNAVVQPPNSSITVYSIKVVERNEMLLRDTIKSVEGTLLGSNTSLSEIKSNLTLPTSITGLDTAYSSDIIWESSDQNVISNGGTVTPSTSSTANVTLTGTYKLKNNSGVDTGKQKVIVYNMTVPAVNDADTIANDLTWSIISNGQAINSVTSDLSLPTAFAGTAGLGDAQVAWSVVSGTGCTDTGVITRATGSNQAVTLKATVSINGSSKEVNFTFTIKGFIGVYMPSEGSIPTLGTAVTNVALAHITDNRDNYLYKFIDNTYSYPTVDGSVIRATQVKHANAVNTSYFYNMFDGTNTVGSYNAYNAMANGPAYVMLDLGQEKYYNTFVYDISANATWSVNNLKIHANSTLANASGTTGNNGTLTASFANTDKWPIIFSDTTTWNNATKTIKFGRVVKSRYILVEAGFTATTDATSNIQGREWQLMLRDIVPSQTPTGAIDYINKRVNVFAETDISSFISGFTMNDNNLNSGIFSDTQATTPITSGNVTDGQYLVTYFGNADTKEVVQAYRISFPAPAVTNVSISGSSDVDQTLTTNYTYIDENGGSDTTADVSTFKWFADGTLIMGASSKTYVVKPEDIGKVITSEVTPRTSNTVLGISVPVMNQTQSRTIPIKKAGNVFAGQTVTNITVTGTNTGGDVPTPPTKAVVESLLNGYVQDVTVNTGTANPKTMNFNISLANPRIISKIKYKAINLDNIGITFKGYLGGKEIGTLYDNTSIAGGTISTVTCNPTLVDEVAVTMTFTKLGFSNGLNLLEAYCGDISSDADLVALEKAAINIPSHITSNLNLYTQGGAYTTIQWQSNNQNAILDDGIVIRELYDQTAELTATITRKSVTDTKVIDVTVDKEPIFDVVNMEFTSIVGVKLNSKAEIANETSIIGKTTIEITPRVEPNTYPITVVAAVYGSDNILKHLFISTDKSVTATQGDIDNASGSPIVKDVTLNIDLNNITNYSAGSDYFKLFALSDIDMLKPFGVPAWLN